ncbi:hypothetical protein ROR02_09770 [Pararhodospirillum oryzae]|uniref:Uncharacterized protein n=2 Tax=Pararhodospirillum oryzae TaxID=478448 RepID=A0A512H5U8_9PROT|nr:hypothetical protein ROR02_09770 [Pararhodospirillum oryzae]
MLFGVFHFVFVAGIMSLFSKYVLMANVAGAALSLAAEGRLFAEHYFLILDFIPELPGVYGALVVVGTTVIAAYNFGSERGWFPPLAE